jgi:hypothetical protein
MVLYSAYTPKLSQREIVLPARWDELIAGRGDAGL